MVPLSIATRSMATVDHHSLDRVPADHDPLPMTAKAGSDYFGSEPSTPSTYQFRRCSSGSASVLPAGTFTALD